MRIADKKHMGVLSVDQKTRLLALREEKQVARFLLPDAPKRKQKRKGSPTRGPCPLMPGVPSTPPPRKLRPWEVEGDKAIPTTSTGSTSSSWVDGRPLGASEAVDVETLPSTSTGSIQCTYFDHPVRACSDLDSLTSQDQDPDLDEEHEASTLLDQKNIGQNPGSDLDDDVADADILDVGGVRHRNVAEYPADLGDLPSHLLHQMHALDAHDDSALWDLVSSEDMLNFDWSSNPDVFKGEREIFNGPSGPTFPSEGMTPLEIFERIWDENIINIITAETNRYANALMVHPGSLQHSRIRRWSDITPKDIWTFFAVIMLQSFVANPVEKEYWYPQMPYLRIGNFNDIMPFKKFQLIKRCLHFVDNSSVQELTSLENSRILKVKPILEHLNNKFSNLYLPEQNIALDESLLLWKGRLSFSQLIATKAARVGIKSYELCESRTGYLWKMEVYAGKGHHFTEGHDVVRESDEPEGATSQIVYRLVSPLLHKGHTLVMDNFYNSPLLSRTLKSKKTDTIGTLRLNRQFVPDSLRNKTKSNMRQGEIAFSQTKDLSVVVWCDSNLVSLISTYHKVEVSGIEKHGYYKYKPKVVLDYNLSMGGVDKKDQLLQAFPLERIRNAVWYKKLFRRLLNISIHNSYVIYTHHIKIPQRQFRMSLTDEILKKFHPPRLPVPAQVPKTGHFPIKEKGRSRCKQCAKRKVDSRSIWACDTCGVHLCIDDCFRKYHVS